VSRGGSSPFVFSRMAIVELDNKVVWLNRKSERPAHREERREVAPGRGTTCWKSTRKAHLSTPNTMLDRLRCWLIPPSLRKPRTLAVRLENSTPLPSTRNAPVRFSLCGTPGAPRK